MVKNSMGIEDRNVVITGGGRGLGRALAEELAAHGANVVVVARSADELAVTVAGIRSRGGRATAVVGDVGAKEDIHRIVGEAVAAFGTVDVLFNNASTLGPVPLRPLADTECEDLERALAVNLVGPFRVIKALLGPMRLCRSGLIVNISSDAAEQAYPTWGAYGASKAALVHLTRTFAAELADTGVRIVAIDPGEMDTRMHREALPDADASTLARPETVAAAIIGRLFAAPRELEVGRAGVEVGR